MACPSSPEDGYHRFKLQPHGLEFAIRCLYCGEAKSLKPFEAETAMTTDQRGRRQSPRQQIALPPRDAVAVRARAERARGGDMPTPEPHP
jgi:hypothetical protein